MPQTGHKNYNNRAQHAYDNNFISKDGKRLNTIIDPTKFQVEILVKSLWKIKDKNKHFLFQILQHFWARFFIIKFFLYFILFYKFNFFDTRKTIKINPSKQASAGPKILPYANHKKHFLHDLKTTTLKLAAIQNSRNIHKLVCS